MGDSLLIILFFCVGIFLSLFDLVPDVILKYDPTLPALWLLMALVGFSLGSDRKLSEMLRTLRPDVLIIPVATTFGTFLGAILASFFLAWTISDCLAMGSGFAYYSLSSVFITHYKGPELGAAALLCNVSRELFTLLFTPLVVKFFGPVAAISCGGATAMDTTLPVISRYAGSEWIFPAIISAIVLDFSVPFWVTLFCAF